MFKTIKELKEFIVWAKDQKLAAVDINGVAFSFSPSAGISEYINQDPFSEEVPHTPKAPIEAYDSEELKIIQEKFNSEEDDELLYHSSTP
mgnify:CR=1 FL=1